MKMEFNDVFELVNILIDLPKGIEVWHEDEFGRKYDLSEVEVDLEKKRIVIR